MSQDETRMRWLEKLAKQGAGIQLPPPSEGLEWKMALQCVKKPKNITLAVWQQAIYYACRATCMRDGYCACMHGRFNIPREARFLTPS